MSEPAIEASDVTTPLMNMNHEPPATLEISITDMNQKKPLDVASEFEQFIAQFSVNVSSAYTIEIRPGFICLVDLDIGRSLTNNAEILIDDLARDGFDLVRNRVIYKDTMGIWDEMLIAGNKFAGFKAIRCTDL